MTTNDTKPRWANRDRALVRAVTELLETGEYERLAELLDQMRLACQQEGDALPAQMLDLARRICLACSQSQAEAEWHQQARKEAAQREDKLRGQLNTLLDLASGAEPIPYTPTPSEAAESASLRQRLQDLLRRGATPAQEPRLPRLKPGEGLPVAAAGMETWDEPGVPSLPREPEAQPGSVPHGEPEQKEELDPATSHREIEEALGAVPHTRPRKRRETGTPSLPPGTEETKEPGQPSLVIHCLGPFRVYQDDHPVVDWPSSKGKTIFKYLVTHRKRPIPKEVLMELFWPGAHPDAARNNLNVAIYGLRQALRQVRSDFSHVLFQDDCYLLNPDLRIWTDVEDFREHCRVAHSLEQSGDRPAAMHEYRAAEALYQGEFLEEDRYEDWLVPLRQNLEESLLSILDRLSLYCLEQEELVACVTLCRKMLAIDACNEEAHRRLMRSYSRQGQRYLALRQYHLCVEVLREQLDVGPASGTTELCERIRLHQQI